MGYKRRYEARVRSKAALQAQRDLNGGRHPQFARTIRGPKALRPVDDGHKHLLYEPGRLGYLVCSLCMYSCPLEES
jgi:hypothetical protein